MSLKFLPLPNAAREQLIEEVVIAFRCARLLRVALTPLRKQYGEQIYRERWAALLAIADEIDAESGI